MSDPGDEMFDHSDYPIGFGDDAPDTPVVCTQTVIDPGIQHPRHGDDKLHPDSRAAHDLVRYLATNQEEKADLTMRLLCRRFEIDRLRMALAEIADPTLNAEECRKIAREALEWESDKLPPAPGTWRRRDG